MADVENIIEALNVLVNDEDVPKNVCSKISSLLKELGSGKELSLTVNKAVSELEDLSNDVNIPAFVRTQLWSVLSLLGALEAQLVQA